MKIAITSGKGGVGKTFVATCLADVLNRTQKLTYIDCDVEAPNAHLFLKSDIIRSTEQTLQCVLSMDPDKCTYCGLCSKACYFNAIVVGKKNALAFPELCRWCKACTVVCPNDALVIGSRNIGTIFQSQAGNIDLNWATLKAGAGGMTVRLIDTIKQGPKHDLVILDSPPGTSCPVVETIKDADIVVLVADPTRFGQHDLKLSVQMCRSMNITPYVIINRSGITDSDSLLKWCHDQAVEVLAQIPDERQIAELYSKGLVAVRYMDDLFKLFETIADKLHALPINDKLNNRVLSFDQTDLFLDSNLSPQTQQDNPKTNPALNEVTIVSGKGGTGKTSISACFAQLSQTTITDCDVDAADMHLLLSPDITESGNYSGGRVMQIDSDKCISCGKCVDLCQWSAISIHDGSVTIEPAKCEGCGACQFICPSDAITAQATDDGRWYFSSTRFGSLSHATLAPGRENSGKLVTLLRKNTAEKSHYSDGNTVVLDGSPGTGCPVIASIGGAKAAVIVTEPTVSGLHDLKRILELTAHFKIPSGVIINKSDINQDVSAKIIDYISSQGTLLLGQLPYNTVFIDAQQNAQTILEYAPTHEISDEIKNIWNKTKTMIKNKMEVTND